MFNYSMITKEIKKEGERKRNNESKSRTSACNQVEKKTNNLLIYIDFDQHRQLEQYAYQKLN